MTDIEKEQLIQRQKKSEEAEKKALKNYDKEKSEHLSTQYYGFSDVEWNQFSETRRQGIRLWAKEKHDVSNGSNVNFQKVWTNYKVSNNGNIVDQILGPIYKYEAFFQNIQDARNNRFFQAAEDERNEISGSQGYVNNPVIPENLSQFNKQIVTSSNTSYSGCDITPSITVGGETFVLGNLSAITYSIHRDKIPVRLLGRTYPKSFTSGGATIAGSLIFSVFDTHVLDQVRKAVVNETQAVGGQSSPLTQQLPPFDVTIFFQNEYGHSSYMRIYGIEISDESQTHSINDTYSENQMQYVARDIDLMCRVGDQFTPQSLAFNNTTVFTKYDLATPAYRLREIKAAEVKIGELKQKQANLISSITTVNNKLSSLNASNPSSEITNLINANLTLLTSLETELASINSKIKSEEVKANSDISESRTAEDAIRLGSNFSSGRDDPYALTRSR